MLKPFPVLLYLLLTGYNIQAQLVSLQPSVAGFYLKANPLALLETDGGIAFSAEYLMDNRRLGFQLEVQPVFCSIGNRKGYPGPEAPVNTLRTGMPLGIEVRPELRYYFTFNKQRNGGRRLFWFLPARFPTTNRSTGRRNYVSADFLYKYIVRERESERDVLNGGSTPAYRQRYIYRDIKQVAGWDIKFGTVVPLSQNGHWLLEYYIGFGGRLKTFHYKNLPDGVAPPNRLPVFSFLPFPSNGRQVTSEGDISIPAGLRIIYQL